MNFKMRRQKLCGVLMSIWLCSWIGVSLLHGFSHASDSDSHAAVSCVVCPLLHQPAPASLDFSFAPRPVVFHEIACDVRLETQSRCAPIFLAAASPRGPPFLFV